MVQIFGIGGSCFVGAFNIRERLAAVPCPAGRWQNSGKAFILAGQWPPGALENYGPKRLQFVRREQRPRFHPGLPANRRRSTGCSACDQRREREGTLVRTALAQQV